MVSKRTGGGCRDTTAQQMRRYIWLLETIGRSSGLTLREIQERWNRSSVNDTDTPLSKRTFHDHKRAIEMIFGVSIVCKSGYRYVLSDGDEGGMSEVLKWLLEAFALKHLSGEGPRMHERIMLDSIPSADSRLQAILSAMSDGRQLQIVFRSFWRVESRTFVVHPYGLRLFQRRWYLVAYSPGYDALRIYSLDRIREVELLEDYFDLPEDFSIREYFRDYVGTAFTTEGTDEAKAQDIILRVSESQTAYLDSLPLHPSQKLLRWEDDFALLSIHVVPTYDFYQLLLSQREEVEVIAPVEVRRHMQEIVRRLSTIYHL